MQIVPFKNDSFNIRTVTEDGTVWFVAKDILNALDYANVDTSVTKILGSVPDEWKGKKQILASSQALMCLTEEGMYFLLSRSDKPKALPLQKWIAGEVLPSIRKTGSYSLQQKPQANESVYLVAHQVLLTVPGLDHSLAAAVTLRMIEDATGVSTEAMRKMLPSLKESAPSLNATAVGDGIGVSPRIANLMLVDAGLQTKNSRGEWEVTEAGRKYGGMVPFNRNGHTGYQPLWRPEVVEFLKTVELEAA